MPKKKEPSPAQLAAREYGRRLFYLKGLRALVDCPYDGTLWELERNEMLRTIDYATERVTRNYRKL